ncbi:MAG: hypothetical protein EAZ73_03900 [Oscillatoriales cyanobacterium]|nr:MAG: hypothetical protein EAZ83_05230 [Oscillatoriales cyanobacterium]TAE93868.1 MAG: hypothetical protein EAZ79_25585 [Oscillatoriales cyanobacterium]TAF22714.1 MAG: hypothetical protein EAZ73_03900 [Oscillatoriales cyanobacterium]TAF36263.1 MAG: hypothetical protein EAZ69_11120 [Oscillatoriales cyanobacterium]
MYQILHENGRAIDFYQIFHKFSTGIYQLQLKYSKKLFYFSTVSTGRSHKNNSIKKSFPPTVNSSLLLQSTLNCFRSQLSTKRAGTAGHRPYQLTTLNCQLLSCQLSTVISFL